MAWCPVCKCEYKKGITVCKECKVELVDSLDANSDEVIFAEINGTKIEAKIFEDVAHAVGVC